MSDFNPRFPHTLEVYRPNKVDGEIVYDEDGNPTYTAVSLVIVAMNDGIPCRNDNGAFITTTATNISFGYRNNASRNAQTSSDVVVAGYEVATPLFLTSLNYGDRLKITDYDRTYYAEVVKKVNSNFGSNIWFNEVQN